MHRIYLSLSFLFCFQICAENPEFSVGRNDCEKHKIVFLISPPRSLSVGFLRMIETRGDFKIFHEPSISVFDFVHFTELTKDWFQEGAYENFKDVKRDLFNEAAHSHVFIKEMSFSLKEFLIEDLGLMKKSNVYFVFLLRNPHHSIISFYHKFNRIFEGFENVIGYRQAYELFDAISAQAHNRPLILFSEDLAAKPKETIEKFCRHIEIPFIETALSWKDLGRDFDASEWNESKVPELVHHWHGEAIRSTGFGNLKGYDTDLNGNPTFAEIKNWEDREFCKKAYELNLPYYLKFKNAVFSPF